MRQSFPQRTSSLARTGTSASMRRRAVASPASMAVFTSKWCRSWTPVLIVSAVTSISLRVLSSRGLCWESTLLQRSSAHYLLIQFPKPLVLRQPLLQGESIHSWHPYGPIEPSGGFAEFEIEVSAGPGQALGSTSSGELVINRLERNAHLAVLLRRANTIQRPPFYRPSRPLLKSRNAPLVFTR